MINICWLPSPFLGAYIPWSLWMYLWAYPPLSIFWKAWQNACTHVNTCGRSNSKLSSLLWVGISSVVISCWRETPLSRHKGLWSNILAGKCLHFVRKLFQHRIYGACGRKKKKIPGEKFCELLPWRFLTFFTFIIDQRPSALPINRWLPFPLAMLLFCRALRLDMQ